MYKASRRGKFYLQKQSALTLRQKDLFLPKKNMYVFKEPDGKG